MYNVGVAYLLWLVSGCGALGFHRFYLNKPATAVLYIFTGGLGMVGSIYDFFTLPAQVREANLRGELRRALDITARRTLLPQRRYAGDELADYQKKETLERTILRVAKRNAGIATPSEVALEADGSLEQVKAALDTLVTKGFAELRVRKSGAIVYVFPEFMADTTEFENF